MRNVTIKIYELTKEFAVDDGVGNAVYNSISSALNNNDEVVLDFSGVNIILSVFLNSAIGSFYTNNKHEEFESKIRVTNLSDSAKILWDRVVESAKRKIQTN